MEKDFLVTIIAKVFLVSFDKSSDVVINDAIPDKNVIKIDGITK